MKYFLVVFLSVSTMAFNIQISWSNDFSKRMRINCNFEKDCFQYFGGVYSTTEEICSDCISTSMKMDFIFNGIGSYISYGKKADRSDFFKLLSKGMLISMDYKTPYNLIDSSSFIKKRMKFRKMCPQGVDPILFFERNTFDEIGRPLYVLCEERLLDAITLELENKNLYELY